MIWKANKEKPATKYDNDLPERIFSYSYSCWSQRSLEIDWSSANKEKPATENDIELARKNLQSQILLLKPKVSWICNQELLS